MIFEGGPPFLSVLKRARPAGWVGRADPGANLTPAQHPVPPTALPPGLLVNVSAAREEISEKATPAVQ